VRFSFFFFFFLFSLFCFALFFVCLLPVACVLNVYSVSGLSILDCPFCFL
jgi:hypothetical protein